MAKRKKKRSSKSIKGISRIDINDQGTHGYMVRLCRQGVKTNRFFSDSVSGGKKKALDKAQKELKKLIKKLPPPDTSRNKMNVRNVSGQVGVYETNSGPSDSDRDYLAYVASWTDKNGKRSKINFSIDKYGKRTAWLLACFAREKEISKRDEVITKFEQSTGKKVKTAQKTSNKKKKATKTKKKVTRKKATRKKATRKKTARKKTKKRRR